MQKLDYKKLLARIKEVFLTESNYLMEKVIIDFPKDNKFFADYFNFIICEPLTDQAPIFYHVLSPFDAISNKAPQQAIVWQNGEILQNIDFTEFANIRTGAMDTLTLQTLNITSLEDKDILIYGTGAIARCSIQALKEIYPDFKKLTYANSTLTQSSNFEKFLSELGIQGDVLNPDELGKFDFIFCHTNTKTAILTAQEKQRLKAGVVITTFITSSDVYEVAEDFYGEDCTVILDWDKNLPKFPEFTRATQKDAVKQTELVLLKELLSGKVLPSKKATVFRFFGTPMQNLAVLK